MTRPTTYLSGRRVTMITPAVEAQIVLVERMLTAFWANPRGWRFVDTSSELGA